jgi:hypothetical protein
MPEKITEPEIDGAAMCRWLRAGKLAESLKAELSGLGSNRNIDLAVASIDEGLKWASKHVNGGIHE